jgi:hypothetical protein
MSGRHRSGDAPAESDEEPGATPYPDDPAHATGEDDAEQNREDESPA